MHRCVSRHLCLCVCLCRWGHTCSKKSEFHRFSAAWTYSHKSVTGQFLTHLRQHRLNLSLPLKHKRPSVSSKGKGEGGRDEIGDRCSNLYNSSSLCFNGSGVRASCPQITWLRVWSMALPHAKASLSILLNSKMLLMIDLLYCHWVVCVH